MNNIKELHKKYVMPTYAPELLFVKGEGSWLFDENGKKYLDFTSGIAVCSLGHCHPTVTEAISRQAAKLVHTSNLFYNENQPRLAEKLIKQSFSGKVFFSNSGAEANEGMIKLARKWGSSEGKFEIIVMENSFHGRTLATLAATGRKKYRDGFAPDMPGFVFVPYNDIDSLKKAFSDKTCAVLLEPVQGEGGVLPADQDFLNQVKQLCTEKNVLLMFDEVQTGIGRTGRFFAWQKYGIEPDLFSVAKALGNGFPIGAFIVKDKFTSILQPGTHASTFGGTPLACAASLAVLETIEQDDILENCREKSKILFEMLEKLKKRFTIISEVRGLGLMIGIVLDCDAAPLRQKAEELGLLVLTAGENVLRLLPPLNISSEELNEALKLLEQAFERLTKN